MKVMTSMQRILMIWQTSYFSCRTGYRDWLIPIRLRAASNNIKTIALAGLNSPPPSALVIEEPLFAADVKL